MSQPYARALTLLQERGTVSPDKPDETPETTARALWFRAAGQPRSIGRLEAQLPALNDVGIRHFEALVDRRLSGEPLAYLTGVESFIGLEFQVGPGALIPRRETELLGRAVIELLSSPELPAPRVLDLCTGSGNLAVALAVRVPQAAVWATDLESEAVRIAGENARLHGVDARITLLQGDLFDPVEQLVPSPAPFDLIVCNPPYIPSRKARAMPADVGGHEPAAAFDGGDFGVSILFRLIAGAVVLLKPGGWLCFEFGAGQGPYLEKRIAANGSYHEVRVINDQAGVARAILARRVAG